MSLTDSREGRAVTSEVAGSKRTGVFAGLLVLTLGVGAAGSLATVDSLRTWYPALQHPAWTPPNSLFAPVWGTLYVLIAIAGWRLYLERPRDDHRARTLWWAQLALNGLWSPVFFGAHLIGAAAGIIGALWFVITFFILITWRPERLAASSSCPTGRG